MFMHTFTHLPALMLDVASHRKVYSQYRIYISFPQTKQNKTKQNKTKQNKTKQNKTKQNKSNPNQIPPHQINEQPT
jgi:hypothetical protein